MKVIIRWKLAPDRSHGVASARELYCPLPRLPRTAVLSPGFRNSRKVRTFPYGYCDDVQAFRPEALAGSAAVLRALARAVLKGAVQLPTVEYAVSVFTSMDHGLLAAEDRDLLWQAFRVPVFEQVIGPRNEVLAVECEAHSGLHMHDPACPPAQLALMLGTHIDETECACGNTAPRLVQPRLARLVRATAARQLKPAV